jgi:hypothetical protein
VRFLRDVDEKMVHEIASLLGLEPVGWVRWQLYPSPPARVHVVLTVALCVDAAALN